MATLESLIRAEVTSGVAGQVWIETLIGLGVGAVGGALRSAILTTPLTHGVLLGGLFGLAFGLFFAKRATSAGAGLIWGLATALLLWMLIPAGILPMLKGNERSMGMLSDARAQFPELVAYLFYLGMPVGVGLGIRGGLRSRGGQPPFRMGRAIVAGGLAGTFGGLIFGRWMSEGDFFPLLAGDRKSTRLNSSHMSISYAVFCLKKKKEIEIKILQEQKHKYNKNTKTV